MKKSIKAAMLSALVCPGMGHFYLKEYKLSVVVFCTFGVPFCAFVIEFMKGIERIGMLIARGDIVRDAVIISEKMDAAVPVWLIAIVFAVWIAAVLDSYTLGCESEAK